MIDNVSSMGYAELSAPATVTTSGAGSGVLNLLLGSAQTPANILSGGQPQGTVAFIIDSTVVTGNGTYVAVIQTSANNSTFTNAVGASGTVFASTPVSNVANTAGPQAIFVDTAFLSQYNRVYDVNATNTSVIRSVLAVFTPKNPS